jgi:hypothetical protein
MTVTREEWIKVRERIQADFGREADPKERELLGMALKILDAIIGKTPA